MPTYIRVHWDCQDASEPVWLYSELDGDRMEVRKVEVFRDGSAGYASQADGNNRSELGLAPVPMLDEIAANPEFGAEEIGASEFEAVWSARHQPVGVARFGSHGWASSHPVPTDVRLRQVARQLLDGRIGVIAAARALAPFQHEVEASRPELGEAFLAFVGIASETDTLSVGALRDMWHPSTAALEDREVAEAEDRWRDWAYEACRRVLALLDQESELVPRDHAQV